jgi:hypothetical protein
MFNIVTVCKKDQHPSGGTMSRVMRTLNRRIERVSDPSRKDKALGTPKAGAGSMKGKYRGFRLLWRAKLADKPCRNRWQLQRINLIAFQAPKRPAHCRQPAPPAHADHHRRDVPANRAK